MLFRGQDEESENVVVNAPITGSVRVTSVEDLGAGTIQNCHTIRASRAIASELFLRSRSCALQLASVVERHATNGNRAQYGNEDAENDEGSVVHG